MNQWFSTSLFPQVSNLAFSALLGIASSAVAFIPTALALEVKITPESPQLGDTIAIDILTNDMNGATPRTIVGGKTYPAFVTGTNRYRSLIPTTPLNPSGRMAIQVQDDGEERNMTVWLRDRAFPTQRIHLRGGGSKATQLELDRVAALKALVTPEKYWNGAFLRPNAGRVSTIFGVRRYYNGVFANDYYHRGVDYASPTGSPVVAPAGGRIALVGRESEGFRVHGNVVGIDHGQGVSSILLHLHSIDVKEGDFVNAGQKIGTVGSTGASTGPHLHWGLYVHGEAVDPVPWRYEGRY